MDLQKSAELQKCFLLKATIFASKFSKVNFVNKQLMGDRHHGISLFMSLCSS